MPFGYPSPCGYPGLYPAYPLPYAGFGGWFALFVVLFILALIFGAWWWYTRFC